METCDSIKRLKLSKSKDVILAQERHLSIVPFHDRTTLKPKTQQEAQVTAPLSYVTTWKICVLVFVSIIVYKLFTSFQTYKCYLERDFQLNLSRLNTDLGNLVGQHDAKKEFVTLINSVNSDENDVLTSIVAGPPGVGKSLAVLSIYKLWPSNSRFLLSTSLLPRKGEDLTLYSNVLNNLACCGKNLVVIENLEYLKKDQVLPFLEFLNMISSRNPMCPGRKVLILVTTADGDEVIEISRSDGKRFPEVVKSVTEFLEKDEVYSEFLSSSTKIIPFYPLEKENLEECFSRLEPNQVIIGKLMKKLEYYKVGDSLFVTGGCRNVRQLVVNFS